jgi:hypothetical protein
LLTTNPIFTALGYKFGIRVWRPATNHPSHCTAFPKHWSLLIPFVDLVYAAPIRGGLPIFKVQRHGPIKVQRHGPIKYQKKTHSLSAILWNESLTTWMLLIESLQRCQFSCTYTSESI